MAGCDETHLAESQSHFGLSVKPDDLRALAMKARHMPAAAAAFQQKRLNAWVNASAPWLSLDGWRRDRRRGAPTGASSLPEALRGRPCWIGVDLSSKIDLTAIVAVCPPVTGASGPPLAPGGVGVDAGRHGG